MKKKHTPSLIGQILATLFYLSQLLGQPAWAIDNAHFDLTPVLVAPNPPEFHYMVRYADPEKLQHQLEPYLLKEESISKEVDSTKPKSLIIHSTFERYATLTDIALKYDLPPKTLLLDVSVGNTRPESRYTLDPNTQEKHYLKETKITQTKVKSTQEIQIVTQSPTPEFILGLSLKEEKNLSKQNLIYAIKLLPVLEDNGVKIKAFLVTLEGPTKAETSLSFIEFKLPLGEWYKIGEYDIIAPKEESVSSSNSEWVDKIPNKTKSPPLTGEKVRLETKREGQKSDKSQGISTEQNPTAAVKKEQIWIKWTVEEEPKTQTEQTIKPEDKKS